jgi:hypothetical protein
MGVSASVRVVVVAGGRVARSAGFKRHQRNFLSLDCPQSPPPCRALSWKSLLHCQASALGLPVARASWARRWPGTSWPLDVTWELCDPQAETEGEWSPGDRLGWSNTLCLGRGTRRRRDCDQSGRPVGQLPLSCPQPEGELSRSRASRLVWSRAMMVSVAGGLHA